MEKTNLNENERDSLIAAYLSGNSSQEEIATLNAWIELSPENQKYFRSFCDVWQISTGAGTLKQENKIHIPEEFHLEEDYPVRRMWINTLKYAAGILLILSIGFLAGKLINSTPAIQGNAAIVYAPMGSRAMSVLPDGTQVWLNAGSKIEYNTQTYNQQQRAIVLVGEAYFKVKTNPQKPFVVNARGFNVKALGTEFNVKAYPEEHEVVTTLVKGIVKIEGKDKSHKAFVVEMKPKQIVKLEAASENVKPQQSTSVAIASKTLEESANGAEGIVQESPVVESDVNTIKYTSWKDNQWTLEGEDIGNLVVMLERKFNVKIIVESPEIKKYKFTGTFRNETLEQVLSVLKIATPIKYKIGKGTVTLGIDNVLKDKYQKFMTE